jgi:hypothetical protein
MKKEQLSPTARNIFDMMMSTESVNIMAEIYHLPTQIRSQIIENTETVEDRNLSIFRICLMYYVAIAHNLNNSDEINKMINSDMQTIMESFIKHTSELINLLDYHTERWRNEH